jgi:hypothetical protein
MKVFLSLALGIAIGAFVYWYLAAQPRTQTSASRVETRIAGDDSNHMATTEAPKENFSADKIKDELARTGKVIREKSEQAGHAIADATADARTTASIKTKLIKDSGLSAFKIDVNTTAGTVTLSGTVSSYDQIVKAMRIALETDGVQRVVSTLQVKV